MLRCPSSIITVLRLSPKPTPTSLFSRGYKKHKARHHYRFMDPVAAEDSKKEERRERRAQKAAKKHEAGQKQKSGGGGASGGTAKLRGLRTDSEDVRLSKTLTWILRHGCQSEGIYMRPDGYVRVDDLLKSPRLKGLDINTIEGIVKADRKTRFHLMNGPDPSTGSSRDIWWIRANQGHSLKTVSVELQPILSPSDIPSGIAVHGTTRVAWDIIRKEGLSKMNRNHIHLAQGVGAGITSGMRHTSQILVYIDLQKALNDGIKFYLSLNGVVLTDGNERGYLEPKYFQRVEDAKGRQVAEIILPAEPGFVPPDKATTVVEPSTAGGIDSLASKAENVLNLDPSGSSPPVDRNS